MTARDLTLNIAVNLGRLARWALEGKYARLKQFLLETDEHIAALEQAPKSEQFAKTFIAFRKTFDALKTEPNQDNIWAESMLTWANILTHRAKLA